MKDRASTPCRIEPFSCYQETLPRLLDAIDADKALAAQQRILIKPNLVNATAPPVTFPVEAASVLIDYCRQWSAADIVIAEGTGERHLTTDEVFRTHGYDRLATEKDVGLIDLNEAPLVELSDPECSFFPSFMMPDIIMQSYVISAATLKAHSLARVTLSMKNMIGVAPPAYYQRGGHWKKSAFHAKMQTAIYELNRYRKPDLALVDASIGLSDHHLGGPTCQPPVDKLVAGFDAVAVDAAGSELLGIPWRQVGHIKMADGILGRAEGD